MKKNTVTVWYPNTNSQTVSNWFVKKIYKDVDYLGTTALTTWFRDEAKKNNWPANPYIISVVGLERGDSQLTVVDYEVVSEPKHVAKPKVI